MKVDSNPDRRANATFGLDDEVSFQMNALARGIDAKCEAGIMLRHERLLLTQELSSFALEPWLWFTPRMRRMVQKSGSRYWVGW